MTIPGMEGGFTEMCFEIAAAAGRASMRILTVLRSEHLLRHRDRALRQRLFDDNVLANAVSCVGHDHGWRRGEFLV